MRGWGTVLLAVTAMGCTTVKLSQRDGCWVRKTERFLVGSKEEVGPCAPPAPQWSEDRLTRLVQECAARADYRWQGRALDSWNRRAPMPERPPEEAVLRDCMSESTRSMLSENAAMKERLGEMAAQRDAMMADRDAVRGHEEEARKQLLASEVEARKQLLASHDKLADYLGQAANKAQAPATATATATSDSAGTAQTESAHEESTSLAADTGPAHPPAVVVTTGPSAPPAKVAASPGRALRKARAVPAAPRECPPAATATSEMERTSISIPTSNAPSPQPSAPPGERERTSTPNWTPTLTLTPPDQPRTEP